MKTERELELEYLLDQTQYQLDLLVKSVIVLGVRSGMIREESAEDISGGPYALLVIANLNDYFGAGKTTI